MTAVEQQCGADARRALELVDEDPRRAWQAALAALAASRAAGDLRATGVAERAAGLAALHSADLDTAAAYLESAVRTAQRVRSRQMVGEARMSLAFVRARRGEVARAVRCVEQALRDLEGTARARALAQRGAILQQLGRVEEALVDYRLALPELQAAQDWAWVQRVHGNRGQVYAYRSQFAAAAAELSRAEEICRREGLQMKLAFVHHNRALLEIRRGDVPSALRHLAQAEQLHAAGGAAVGAVLVDRSELLLSVGLVTEAREAAQRAVEEFTRLRRRINLPEALLLVATAALLEGDAEQGRRSAQRAVRLFTVQRRHGWAALARLTALRSRRALHGGRPVSAGELLRVAATLSTLGWPEPAVDARLLAVQVLLERGQVTQARAELERVRPHRRRLPAELRARSWYAEALLHEAGGRRPAALHALRRGLRVLEEHQAALRSSDLRASASARRRDLVGAGLRLSVAGGRARAVFEWAERGRAVALLARPARPPQDPALRGALSELRGVVAELEVSRASGQAGHELARRRVALERAVRDLVRLGGEGSPERARGAQLAEVASALTDEALVEYLELDGRLSAVVVAGGRAVVRELGDVGDVQPALAQLPFALRRSGRPGSGRTLGAAQAALRAAAERLDAVLLAPLEADVGDRPLVVVPTGPLQALPFGLLPRCRGRAVTVAPSAALWLRAVRAAARSGPVLAVAGPGLPAAPSEAASVAALYSDAQLLTGDEATAEAVLRALPHARAVHVAAHGRLRADNPLFSSLLLADGPLTAYDLEALPQVPALVVLAACEAARSRVLSGDELLGLAACFLTAGTQALIAPLVPVADDATAQVMVGLHELLRTGVAPATALARLQHEAGEPGPWAAAAGLVCLGAGQAALGPVPPSQRPSAT